MVGYNASNVAKKASEVTQKKQNLNSESSSHQMYSKMFG